MFVHGCSFIVVISCLAKVPVKFDKILYDCICILLNIAFLKKVEKGC
mgnify:FL=1